MPGSNDVLGSEDLGSKLIRIAIVVGIPLYGDGLVAGLSGSPDLTIVAAVPNAHEAAACVLDATPDVVLIDAASEAALDVVRAIAAVAPASKIVAFGVRDVDDQVLAFVEAGAAAYLPTDGTLIDLVATIRALQRDEVRCSPRAAAALFRRVARLARSAQRQERGDVLTSRERQILMLIAEGLSNKEIADHLNVGVATVKNHVHNLLEKMKVHSRMHAAALVRGSTRVRAASLFDGRRRLDG